MKWLIVEFVSGVLLALSPPTAQAQLPPCLPPGMPALSTLVRMGGNGSLVPAKGTDNRVERAKAWVSYWGSPPGMLSQYMIVSIEGEIATVDDHPYDWDETAWYDTGMVEEDGSYIAHGQPTCKWKHLARDSRRGVEPKRGDRET